MGRCSKETWFWGPLWELDKRLSHRVYASTCPLHCISFFQGDLIQGNLEWRSEHSIVTLHYKIICWFPCDKLLEQSTWGPSMSYLELPSFCFTSPCLIHSTPLRNKGFWIVILTYLKESPTEFSRTCSQVNLQGRWGNKQTPSWTPLVHSNSLSSQQLNLNVVLWWYVCMFHF